MGIELTIAQQLGIKDFPFIIKDLNGNKIYFEDSDGFWWKREYNSSGEIIYFEESTGYWWKKEYNSSGKQIYFEGSSGYWWKRQYDANGDRIYYEDSDGTIVDNRPASVELTLDEVATKFGINVKQLKIKK